MASSSGKQSHQSNNRRPGEPFNKRPNNKDNKFEIITKVQSQKGIRGQLVLFQSSTDPPSTILHNAIDRVAGAYIVVHKMETKKDSGRYQLTVNNEILAEDWYTSESAARKGLAKLAVDDLTKTCFAIFRKLHLRDTGILDLASPGTSNASSTEFVSPAVPTHLEGVGAKLMLQMGWSGGGLGAEGQGRTDIVQPYIQIQRQGLGTVNFVQEVTKILQDYAASRNIDSIAFSPDLSKEERDKIHCMARKFNLKSKSYGPVGNRLLVVQSKVKPWDLVYSLLEAGGETEEFKLILPTDFVK